MTTMHKRILSRIHRERLMVGLFLVGAMIMTVIKSSAANEQASLPFNELLSGYKYSSIYYHFGGNSFAGMVFRSTGTSLATGEVISLNGKTVSCNTRLNGYYFNNLRGWRLWPLDTGSLAVLTTKDTNYGNMTFTGGLYTDCTGNISSTGDIYGQIKHTRGGINYNITAGVDYSFTGNYIPSTATLSGNIRILTGMVKGLLYDNYGGIGELGQIILGNTIYGASNGTINSQCISFTGQITNNGSYNFTCTGTNVNKYTLSIFSASGSLPLITGNIVASTANSYTRNMALATGNYIAFCTTNIGSYSCNPVTVNVLTGTTSTTTSGYTTTGGMSYIVIPTIPTIKHAQLKKLYQSDEFIINSLTGTTLASLSKGVLYINGTGVGNTGYVINGDKVSIELISSDEYDTTVSTEITIGKATTTFAIVTMNPDDEVCQLTKSEKAKVEELFTSIKTGYANNQAKWINVIYTMKSMLKDVMDFDYNCSLQYMQDLIDQETDTESDTHIAPNCKEYTVVFNSDKGGYTSSNFKKAQYFASIEALSRFIDARNPGDCHINTYTDEGAYEDSEDLSKHIAPNGKVYEIVDMSGYFYSSTIGSTKKFDTREILYHYIDVNNPTIPVWDHEVDTDREPITYATNNNKEYKIYKTDKGYMSYMLLKVKYFDTLDDIQNYIEANNR